MSKQKVFNEFHRVLKPNGRLSFFEPVFREMTKITDILDPKTITNYENFKEIEHQSLLDQTNYQINFDTNDLVRNLRDTGFNNIKVKSQIVKQASILTRKLINNAYFFQTPPPNSLTLEERFSKHSSKEEISRFLDESEANLADKPVTIEYKMIYFTANKKSSKQSFWDLLKDLTTQ